MFSLSNLTPKDVFIDIPHSDFRSVVSYMIKNSKFTRKEEAIQGIIDREALGTTAIEHNVAIPHCRLRDFRGFYVKFALFKKDPGYAAPNGEGIRYMFLIVGSEDDTGYYLRALAHIAQVAQREDTRKDLIQAKDKKEICKIFTKYENKELEKTHVRK